MNFLAILLSLLLQQFWRGGTPVHQDHRFARWRSAVARQLPAAKLVAILVPTLLLWWLMAYLHSVLFGLLWIIVGAIVLAYTMGRGDYRALSARYRGYCEQGDYEAAYLFLQQELGRDGSGDVADVAQLQASAHAALLYEGYQRWFPPLLYFLLLGPAGALLYRLIQLSWREDGGQQEARWLAVLDWLPSRLLALSFALTGDFVRCRSAYRRDLFTTAPPRELLHRIAEAAAVTAPVAEPGECCNQNLVEVSGLLSRSAILWVSAVALLALLL